MRTSAQIDELALPVQADFGIRQAGDDLRLEGLADPLEEARRLRTRQHLPGEREVGDDDLAISASMRARSSAVNPGSYLKS